MRLVSDEIDLLDECAIGVPRLEPERLKLLCEIGNSLLLTWRAGSATFHGIGGEILDVLEQRGRVYRLRGGSDGGCPRRRIGKGR